MLYHSLPPFLELNCQLSNPESLKTSLLFLKSLLLSPVPLLSVTLLLPQLLSSRKKRPVMDLRDGAQAHTMAMLHSATLAAYTPKAYQDLSNKVSWDLTK
jgi:hypothetical protein